MLSIWGGGKRPGNTWKRNLEKICERRTSGTAGGRQRW